jgi:subtilisin family serine protease
VRSAYLNAPAAAIRMAFVPNDPYFPKDTPVPGFAGQWNLKNVETAGLDARVEGAWNRNITGAGVIIGIIDTGFQTTHPDLLPNYVAADSWDFGQNDSLPDPVVSDDNHATAVAGIAAARGGNGIGITGAAPQAGLAGLRCDFWGGTTAQFVDATLYHSSGGNTNIKVKNHSYGYNLWVSNAAEEAALETSASAGTLHAFSAGNSGADGNKRDLQNSWGAVAVAAMGSDGLFATYSDFGAHLFVTAPSNSQTSVAAITTTDRTGADGYNPAVSYGDSFPDNDYTSMFGGTSAVAPLVSGVMALGKQVRPTLDVRFAKHLLVRSSTVVDPTDSTVWSDNGWQTNAAGFAFNQNYGFGLINADKFTELAEFFLAVTPLVVEDTGLLNVDQNIPDDNLDGVIRTFSIATDGKLEEVLVTLDVDHPYRGDLEAYLTSPSGSVRRLFMRDGGDSDNDINWTFLSNAFWGENAQGTWSLMVRDVFADDVGFWNSYSVEARMGDVIPEPATLGLLAIGLGAIEARRRRRSKAA